MIIYKRWLRVYQKLIKGALTDKIDDRDVFMKWIDYSYYYEEYMKSNRTIK